MGSIFISYRRQGVPELAGRIADNLEHKGMIVNIDENLTIGRFPEQLYRMIDNSIDFIAIVDPSYLEFREPFNEDWCLNEIKYALAKKKNIIPIFFKDFYPQKIYSDHFRIIKEITSFNGPPFEYKTGCFKILFDWLLKALERQLKPHGCVQKEQPYQRIHYPDK